MLIKKRIKNYRHCREQGLSIPDALLVALKSTRTVIASFDTGGKSVITNWRDARGLFDHEPKTREWLKGKHGVFYDIGAHIGKFSFAAEREGMRVYAFEPHFENFRTLCHNVLINKSNVVPLPIAICSKTGIMSFPLSSLSSGSANHGLMLTSNVALPVISFPLADLKKTLGIPPPDYLKIDVDGVEAGIIEHAALESVKEILVEPSSEESRARIASALEKDFSLVDIDELVGVRERGKQYPRNEFWKRKALIDRLS